MFINWKQRELNLNIVYYGPALSGKTTNLQQIHARLNPQVRSNLFTLNTHEDRTIFFDFMQLKVGEIGGLQPKFGLYTVPGQVYYQSTRESVLQRADGVVFVADSQTSRLSENQTSWQDMKHYLTRMGRRLPDFPTVVQFNKRDLSDILPVGKLKTALAVGGYPCYESIAIDGVGVPETLHAAMRAVLADAQQKLSLQLTGGSTTRRPSE